MFYPGKYDHIAGRSVNLGKKNYKEYLWEYEMQQIPEYWVEILIKTKKNYGKK